MRDPTVFVPRSKLATPSYIDHDYNFLHSIEHRIERSEKEIIEDRRLLRRKDLEDARKGQGEYAENGRSRQERKAPGEESIDALMRSKDIRVHKAPKGIRRNIENTTSWSKGNRDINWQVEWMRQGGTERALGKILGNKSLAWYYDIWCEEERKLRMTDEERRADKKRKGLHNRQRQAKRQKTDSEENIQLELSSSIVLQDPKLATWSLNTGPHTNLTPAWSPDTYCREYNHQLFLLRPHTPSSLPKVLAPINPQMSLTDILRQRDILEFPTIYVFETPVKKLPSQYMLEEDFLVHNGQTNMRLNASAYGSNTQVSSEDEKESCTSSNEDEEMEDRHT